MEERLLDRAMGSSRSYIIGRLPTLQENIENRRVIGNSLLATNRTKVAAAKPREIDYPADMPRKERKRLLRDTRRSQLELVEGRMVSMTCNRHGTLAGYMDWFCKCSECEEAYHAHQKSKKIGESSLR